MKRILSTTILMFIFALSFAQTTHTVTISNFAFSPQNLTITKGDLVVWKNSDATSHTSTSGTNCPTADGTWNTGTISGSGTESSAITFNTAGSFSYFCAFHCSMTGSITVSDVAGITDNKSIVNFNSFPNPANDNVNIELNLISPSQVRMEVCNLLGKIVNENIFEGSLSSGNNSLSINTSSLEDGIYLLKVYSNGDIAYTQKLIKSKN